MTALLVNHLGTPEPSPEIQRRLRGVHPQLHLRYLAGGGHWALCFEWSENDARRERIQRRDLDPDKAYDIVGYLPMNCSVDQAPAYLEKSLRSFPKAEIQRMADDVWQYNETAPAQQAVEEAIAEVLNSPDPTGTEIKRPRGRPRKYS